jgi:hypothetical protein
MAKTFYTEREIDDLVKGGVTSLEINDDVVLTVLAYEKANQLGLLLIQKNAENLPGAPVRPYISLVPRGQPVPAAPAPTAAATTPAIPAVSPPTGSGGELHTRIRSAVITRLGTQIDAGLLDNIIQRVLVTTGLK